jgi:branched-chain amino acid transport system permease protein
MDTIVQGLVMSLFLASYYVLVASGLAIQFSILRIINFAHGQFYMLGSFVVFFMFAERGLNFYLVVVLAMAVMAVAGLLMEWFYFRIMGDQEMPAVIGAMGIALIIERLMSLQVGTTPKRVPYIYDGILRFSGTALPVQRLLVIIVAIVLMTLVAFFISRTKVGKAMRAVAQDAEAAGAQGINVNFIRLLAMGLGSALAAAAGALLAPLFQAFVHSGLLPMVKGFIIIILGGLGSLGGAVIGALILGLVDGFGTQHLGHTSNILGFAIVFLILVLRPQGILGREIE